MFSENSVDNLSVTMLIKVIRNFSNELDNRIDRPHDALEYVNAIINLSTELRNRIECVIEE